LESLQIQGWKPTLGFGASAMYSPLKSKQIEVKSLKIQVKNNP
jgi:hypothetical protein